VAEAVKTAVVVTGSVHRAESPVLMKGKPAAMKYPGWSLSRKAVATGGVLSDGGLFALGLRFGSVTGFMEPAPSPKPRPRAKILAAQRYIFSVNALATSAWRKNHGTTLATNPGW